MRRIMKGNNMIHMATQGNQMASIFYFQKNFNINVNDTDLNRWTPLHWAAVSMNELSLTYLIAWGAKVNLPNIDGNSPLHLAVFYTESLSNRWAKILLLKGANREARNNQNQLPVEMVQEWEAKDELVNDLRQPSYLKCLMLSVPLTKINKEWSTVVYFIIAIFLMQGGFVLLIYPLIHSKIKYFFWTVDICLFMCTMSCYFIATIKGNFLLLNKLI